MGDDHKPCDHPPHWVRIGEAYDYCEWCGAVRHKPKRNGVRIANAEWHVCEQCRMREDPPPPSRE